MIIFWEVEVSELAEEFDGLLIIRFCGEDFVFEAAEMVRSSFVRDAGVEFFVSFVPKDSFIF
jgi:hypothetical protein